MFHLLAFCEDEFDGTAGNVQLNAVADDLFQITSDRFRIPDNYDLVFAYAGGATLLRARINTSSLRTKGFPQVYPINVTLVAPTNPGLADWRSNPVKLRYDEDLQVDATNTVALAGDTLVAVGLTQQNLQSTVLPSDARWVRATATPTMTAFTWSTPVSMTFEENLESGRYGIYGMDALAGDSALARLVFNDQYMRPGCLVRATAGLVMPKIFQGGLGLWGMFRNTVPPQLQCLGTVAGAEATSVNLLISKLSD